MASKTVITKNIILNSGQVAEKRQEILSYFHQTFDLYERLFAVIKAEDSFYKKAIPQRHPLIFYFGHTATFFVNKLLLAQVIDARIDLQMEAMMAIGVDEMSWDDMDERHYDWPSLATVKTYRDKVRDLMDKVIRNLSFALPIDWNSPMWVVLMGIEHERIHLETSSVLIRQLPIERVTADPFWQPCRSYGSAPQNSLIPVVGGQISLGKIEPPQVYGWDNEFGSFTQQVAPFKASKFLTSNGEFLQFVNDEGYKTTAWWTAEGQSWVKSCNITHPTFWVNNPGNPGWRLRLMLEEIELPLNWPVEVNFYEAQAFCNWLSQQKGTSIRLPTESEWYRLRAETRTPDEPDWQVAPGNINLEHGASSVPVDRFPFGEFYDVIGNVWQWTQTPIAAFPDFKVHPVYDDFSVPTFDDRHLLMKGGSWISTGNEATKDCRYAFRPHFFQHAGFRYIEASPQLDDQAEYYETDEQISQYCEFHFGDTYFDIPNFSQSCAQFCLEKMGDRPQHHALDIGCAVGRSTFELARQFEKVTGLDFSARFIQVGLQMKEQGALRYQRREEGGIFSKQQRRLADLALLGTASKVAFFQADACNLKPHFSDYDLIFAGNLIDRLYDPARFLLDIHRRIKIGGLLVLSSPYTWLTDFTPRENWIGGQLRDDKPYDTFQALSEILSPHFQLIDQPQDIPFVLRETRRKFQHTLSQISAWERRR